MFTCASATLKLWTLRLEKILDYIRPHTVLQSTTQYSSENLPFRDLCDLPISVRLTSFFERLFQGRSITNFIIIFIVHFIVCIHFCRLRVNRVFLNPFAKGLAKILSKTVCDGIINLH